MGHCCKTLLPVAGTLLQPRYSTEEDTRATVGNKQRQQYYYNTHTKPLQPIDRGETVHIKLPGQKTWSAGTCMGPVGLHSYEVKVGESVYRLLQSGEPPVVETPDYSETITPSPETAPQPQQLEPATQVPASPVPQAQPASHDLRRSQRTHRPPARLNDYVTA